MAKSSTSGLAIQKGAWRTGQLDVSAAGTAEQLSSTSIPVPVGCQLTIVAKPGNTDTIYLGNSKANCESSSVRFDGLAAGLAVSLKVTDVNLVWVDAGTTGEGVSWCIESDS